MGRAYRTRVERLVTALMSPAGRHWLFLSIFACGVALRIVVQIAYWPALYIPDSRGYLLEVDRLEPRLFRPIGYTLILLLPALRIVRDVAIVPIMQHLIGLAMGVLTYGTLLRLGAWRWLAAMTAVPVLLDAYQLHIEQMVVTDTLFELLVLAGLVVLIRRARPGLVAILIAALLWGVSATVRQVGLPLIVAAVVFLFALGSTWRRRLATGLAATLAFAAPVVAYACFYHSEHGAYAVSEMHGRALYGRVTTFVRCDHLETPDYERPLCPEEPVGQRRDPTYYVWQAPTLHDFKEPVGMEQSAVLSDFAHRAIAQQPVDYLRTVWSTFRHGFAFSKDDSRARLWQFPTDSANFPRLRPELSLRYGGGPPRIVQPLADFLHAYQRLCYVRGPFLAAFLTVGLLGVVCPNARRPGMRAGCLLCTVVPAGLLLVPAATAQFSWRYQLPGLVLLPMAGALGVTALAARALEDRDRRRALDT